MLRGRNWQVLDDLATRADDDGRASDDGRANAVAIVAMLRAAARRDEHEAPLGAPLRNADRATLNLMMQWAAKRKATPDSDVGAGPGPEPTPPTRIRARDVPALLNEIGEAVAANPDAEFEITWRIVAG